MILWCNVATFTASSVGCLPITHRVRLTKQELTETVDRDELQRPIVEAGFTDGQVVEFDSSGATYLPQRDMIRGTTKDGRYFERDASDLSYVRIRTVNQTATALGAIVIGVALFAGIVYLLAVAATREALDS